MSASSMRQGNLKKKFTTICEAQEKFFKEFKLYGVEKAKQFYTNILQEMKDAVCTDNVNYLKKLSNLLVNLKIKDKVLCKFWCDIKNNNFVILTCQYNTIKTLDFLFDCNGKILKDLLITVLPNHENGEHHNAFYYAIRSGNAKLLETLIDKWPDDYFVTHTDELNELLSSAYQELKLKNISLSDEVQVFVEDKLIDLRFLACDKQTETVNLLTNIIERINLVVESIAELKRIYLDARVVDGEFLLTAKFVARNIHVLKRQLKATYNKIPWEEIEFCLISFVASYENQGEMNIYYCCILSKTRVLRHLENFAGCLIREIDAIKNTNVKKLIVIPNLNREKVVASIIEANPSLADLYADFTKIRDVLSLNTIRNYTSLAVSADCRVIEGKLIIARALQVTGEHVKNTLESPKLSAVVSEILLLSTPNRTREIVTGLRNLLSHTNSLGRRTEIENNTDINLFINIQNDIKKINVVITDTLHRNDVSMAVTFLEKIVQCSSSEIKEVFDVFERTKSDAFFRENYEINDGQEIKDLIRKLNDKVNDKTSYEKQLFETIDDIYRSDNLKLKDSVFTYGMALQLIKSVYVHISSNQFNENIIRGMKFHANRMLEMIPKVDRNICKQIARLACKIANSARLRFQEDDFEEVKEILHKIIFIAEIKPNTIKGMELLKVKLNKTKGKENALVNTEMNTVPGEIYRHEFQQKLSILENILSINKLSSKSTEEIFKYKNNKKLQAAMEMVVLDVMSVLSSLKNYLTNNFLFVDDDCPVLIGRCLRNHLAHGNSLTDILLFDPVAAVISNAKKLTEVRVIQQDKKIGKLLQDEPWKLKRKHNQTLLSVSNQERMFAVLEKGCLEDVLSCIEKGADCNARNFNLWSTLHFAAKGPSLDVVKFIISQISSSHVKNINAQTPLHIAAAYGRKDIVEYFLKTEGLFVDDLDDSSMSALHLAAKNGCKDVVELLVKNGADTHLKCTTTFAPVHLAILNNHKEVAEILLKQEMNVDVNQTLGGYTSLHISAENGYLELVNFLLQCKANVNARNDKGGIPLHTTALNGHLEVVKALILGGSNINAKVITGCTSLHYAVETGRDKVVELLLHNGADVNVADKAHYYTPLHYASKDGYERIVRILLKNGANVNVETIIGRTPLHFAAEGGHNVILDHLLEAKALINTSDHYGWTPLHASVISGHKHIAVSLIEKGAGVNVKNCAGYTSLHLAAETGRQEIVKMLIGKGADATSLNCKGFTPLCLGAIKGHRGVVEILMNKETKINTKYRNNMTLLHIAASSGNQQLVDYLIRNGADVTSKNNEGQLPLHIAAFNGCTEIVETLMRKTADVDIKTEEGITPLYLAVQGNHKAVAESLLKTGAKVNMKAGKTPLCLAVSLNCKEMVKLLTAYGADVNANGCNPLVLALMYGFVDIAELLLKNKNIDVNIRVADGNTLLHTAAVLGYSDIVEVLLQKGADINALSADSVSVMCIAAVNGHVEIIKVLLANQANFNVMHNDGTTPLHAAASFGHSDAVSVLLSKGGVNIRSLDCKNRTALDLAIAHGHLEVVKMLMEHREADINAKGNSDWTALHIAAQKGRLEVVKYLVGRGCDINSNNKFGSKPVHIAAREGHKDVLQYFLDKGISVNDIGAAGWTLLHYAAAGGHSGIVEFLIGQKVDLNVRDVRGSTPIHVAADCGRKDVIGTLLKKGAVYNAVDLLNRKPVALSKTKDVTNALVMTEKLFEAVKQNHVLEVESCLKRGAYVNAKNNGEGVMPLHYAAWKGYEQIVDTLLKNNADPNAVGKGDGAPLHYAAKFGRLSIIEALLSNGAIYNAANNTNKVPLEFAVDHNVKNLLSLVHETFYHAENCDSRLFTFLKKARDKNILKPIMCARNRKHRTLLVTAIHSNFPKLKEFKQMLRSAVSIQIFDADHLISEEKFQEALSIYVDILEKMRETLGSENPVTLKTQKVVASILYKQYKYQEALNLYEKVYAKQKEILGLNYKDTLNTRSYIGLVLHRQGNDEQALTIYEEVYQKQKDLLGADHSDTLDSLLHMALVLNKLRRFDDALKFNYEVFEERKNKLGAFHPHTLCAQNNIAMVLSNQGKYKEAVEVYKIVYEARKVVLGPQHSDTLRALYNFTAALGAITKGNEMLESYRDVINTQKKYLGSDHLDTLNTQVTMANDLFAQGNFVAALQAYEETYDQLKVIMGPNHPQILGIQNRIEGIKLGLQFQDMESFVPPNIQNDINVAASNGDEKTVKDLIDFGADVNSRDVDGRTPLHFAVNNNHHHVVSILLKNGADPTRTTNKGNTTLHTASLKGYGYIIQLLLQHARKASPDRFHSFINAKTTVAGNMALHVATKSGFYDIVLYLLQNGAVYSDRCNGKTPLQYSNEKKITDLLELIGELFECAERGDYGIVGKLRDTNRDAVVAALNARNCSEQTLVQVASVNRHKEIASALVRMLMENKHT